MEQSNCQQSYLRVQREFMELWKRKQAQELEERKAAHSALTPKQQVAFYFLQRFLDELGVVGLDSPFFSHATHMQLIKAAKQIKVLERQSAEVS